jgi:hypothetical protein
VDLELWKNILALTSYELMRKAVCIDYCEFLCSTYPGSEFVPQR